MAKKKKGDGPKRKRIKFEVNADIDQKRFLKVYHVQCDKDGSVPCPWLVKAMKHGIEGRAYTREFIIEDHGDPPVRLDPVLSTIRKAHYLNVHELRVWDIELPHVTVANLSLLMEKGTHAITKLELMDCDIIPYSIARLSRTFRLSNLSEVNLDYNEFGDEGCENLCEGCRNNKTIISLSLCYCNLTSTSGLYLGEVAQNSAIREFYLDGNQLECHGLTRLIQAVSLVAQDENTKRIEEERLKALMMAGGALLTTDTKMTSQMGAKSSEASGAETDAAANSGEGKEKKKKKKGKKKKKEPDPPVVGPYIYKLHVADNGIDAYSSNGEDALLVCISTLSRLIMYSDRLEELDLEDNPIGDLAAKELLVALNRRTEGKLPNLKMKTTCEIQKDTFSAIVKLASGLKKKKKKGKKKKKKK